MYSNMFWVVGFVFGFFKQWSYEYYLVNVIALAFTTVLNSALYYLCKEITVFDLAKYILAKLKMDGLDCTHLKLQKLVYFCYEKYLIVYNKKLFKEKIYAWKFGPVVKELYDKIKGKDLSHKDYVNLKVDLEAHIHRQRIIFSESGLDKLEIIDSVIDNYKYKTADELVDISHKEGSVWSNWDKESKNFEITDEMILNVYK